MVLWQWINDNLPLYAEQITVNEEVEQTADLKNERDELIQDKKELEQKLEQIQETLSQFKQLVPEGFKKLEPAKKNNWGSTEGLDKTLCERYLFVRENNKPIWLDITHELMEKLELPMGKTFPWPFYLKSEVLESEREETEGAITIEKEEEIFLKKSFTVENLEEDIDKLFKKIEDLKREKNEQLIQKDGEINNLKSEIKRLESELAKEKGWWDKWMNDNAPLFKLIRNDGIVSICDVAICYLTENSPCKINPMWNAYDRDFYKKRIKEKIYKYYRDK